MKSGFVLFKMDDNGSILGYFSGISHLENVASREIRRKYGFVQSEDELFEAMMWDVSLVCVYTSIYTYIVMILI